MKQILLKLLLFANIACQGQTLNFQPGYGKMFYSDMAGFGFTGEISVPLKKHGNKYFLSASIGGFYATQDKELSFDEISPGNHRIVTKDFKGSAHFYSEYFQSAATYSKSAKTARTSHEIIDLQFNRNFQLNNFHQISLGLGVYVGRVFHHRFSHFVDIYYFGGMYWQEEQGYAVTTSYAFMNIGPKIDLRYTYLINPKFHLGLKVAYYHIISPYYGLLQITPNFIFRF